MCNIIVVNEGEVEIETPQEFLDYFGFEPILEKYYNRIEWDYCLCQIDLDVTFDEHNIEYYQECGDYFISN